MELERLSEIYLELACVLPEGVKSKRDLEAEHAVTILQDRIANHWQLRNELLAWLNQKTITSENIGDIRRSLFVPWDSGWNAIVRDETAARENATERKQS